MITHITIAYEFFKIGLFSIGGGLATLPFLFDLTTRYNWFTAQELTNMIAVSESSPGPIGINMATYVGFRTGGALGGILSTLALVAPSIIVILIVARVLEKFKDSLIVKDMFYGLRAAVAGLIGASALSVLMQNLFISGTSDWFLAVDYKKAILFIAILLGVFKLKKHPILYIGVGALLGVLLGL